MSTTTTTSSNENERPEDLLTPVSYALSLGPPRAPPLDSAHRALMAGKDPRRSRFHLLSQEHCKRKMNHNYHTRIHHGRHQQSGAVMNCSHSTWVFNLLHRAHLERCPHGKHKHPHLQDVRDTVTRWLGRHISVATWNKLRDDGWLRSVADTLVVLGIPAMIVTSPRAVMHFLTLTSHKQTIPYGTHILQRMDLWMRPNSKELIVFVHGGAWGSGMPWMYRLVAHTFHDKNVAILGYRTYPDTDIPGQVKDLSRALQKLQTLFSKDTRFTIMGHSSGAHIALLHVIQQAKNACDGRQPHSQPQPYQTFVGLSGPYNIAHHYDYEASRGVEELSPLKAAGGFSLEQLQLNSPARALANVLLECQQSSRQQHSFGGFVSTCIQPHMPSNILLLHGMEDTTVPFTSTAEMARQLVQCGLTPQQSYLAKTGHQDTVLQLMLGGLTQDKVMTWLQDCALRGGVSSSSSRTAPQSTIEGMTSRL